MNKSAITLTGLLLLAAAAGSGLSWGQAGFGPGETLDPVEALKQAKTLAAPAVPASKPAPAAAQKGAAKAAPAGCTCFGIVAEWNGAGRCSTYSTYETAAACVDALAALTTRSAFSKVEYSFDASGSCNGPKKLEVLTSANCVAGGLSPKP